MTVKELKKALENVKDETNVVIFMPQFLKPNAPPFMYFVERAEYKNPSPISNAEFEIEAGQGFMY